MSEEITSGLRCIGSDVCLRAADHIEHLEQELEREQLRLAACGIAALSNTPDSRHSMSSLMELYNSGSLESVISLVEQEMELRAENNDLKTQLLIIGNNA